MVIADYPVGESVYQFSLAPYKGMRKILQSVEDCVHFMLDKVWSLVVRASFWVYEIVERISRVTWNKVLYPFGAAFFRLLTGMKDMLQHLARKIVEIEILRNSVKSIWQMCGSLKTVLSRVLHSALNYIVSIVDGLVQVVDKFLSLVASLLSKVLHSALNYIVLIVDSLIQVVDKFLRLAASVLSQVLRLALNYIVSIVDSLIQVVDKFLRLVASVLSQGIDWALESLGAIANRVAEVLRPSIAFFRDLVSSAFRLLLDTTILCLDMATNVVHRTWSGLSDYVIEPCIRTVTAATRRTWTFIAMIASRTATAIERLAVGIWRSLLVPSLRRFFSCCDTVCQMAVIVLSPFFKKYWQLLSAGLALNGSYRCLAAAILTNSSSIDRVKYLLGAWSLAVITHIVAMSVLSSRGTLASQRVTVEGSALKFMDLRLCSALSRVCSSGWHGLSKAMELLLKAADFMVRKTCSGVWWIGVTFQSIIKPALTFVLAIVSRIWNSPYVSILAAAGAVSVAYFFHQNQVTWDIPTLTLDILHIDSATNTALSVIYSLLNGLSIAVSSVGKFFHGVYSPIVNADASSPDVALSCWLFASAATKGRVRVRVKTFAVPVVVFYLSGVARSSIFKAVFVSLLVWFGLSLVVDRYEEQSRERTRAAFETYQQQSNLSPSGTTCSEEASTCVICLDDICAQNQMMLPCGHVFHGQCIQRWIQTSSVQRCPTCRRATGGFDRFLEVAF
jgi:hypothetical protein